MTDDEIRARCRIVSDPSWRVESLHKGNWVVAFYCSNQKSAEKCLERQIVRMREWMTLTPDERNETILRQGDVSD